MTAALRAGRWGWGSRHYGAPMVLLLASMVVMMGAQGTGGAAAALTLQGLALMAILRAAEVRPWLLTGGSVLAALTIVLAWLRVVFAEQIDPLAVPLATVGLVLVATPIVVVGLYRQTRKGQGITLSTLIGAVCVYLLISLAFASAFLVTDIASGTPFFQQGPEFGSLRNCLYFSLITITTAGLGDLSPANDLGRSLTASEALIGQIYIITVVALMVGRMAQRPISR